MLPIYNNINQNLRSFRKVLAEPLKVLVVANFLLFQTLIAQAQEIDFLPQPTEKVSLSAAFEPVLMKGLTVYAEDPFRLDFIVDRGDSSANQEEVQKQAVRLIQYFLAALTIPEDDLWVNLSPYEKDRIIPETFGMTEMGHDLLAQDYILKQLTASMMYPEAELGQMFWERIYQKVRQRYGTSDIPVDTFNKVWIIPDEAEVFEHNQTVLVAHCRLKVLLEEDYLALEASQKHNVSALQKTSDTQGVDPQVQDEEKMAMVREILKEVIIPELEREVNEGANFTQLRQVYHSYVLAAWYKQRLREGLLNKIYVDQNKVAGIDVVDQAVNNQIYERYVEAFTKGVYDYIREDYDPVSQKSIPRKYFSGGAHMKGRVEANTDMSMLTKRGKDGVTSTLNDESEKYVFSVDLRNQRVAAASLTGRRAGVGVDPAKARTFLLKKRVLEGGYGVRGQGLLGVLDDIAEQQNKSLSEQAGPGINREGYPTIGALQEALSVLNKRLVIYANSKAPVYAILGFLAAMNMSAEDVIVVAEDPDIFQLAGKYFPNIVSSAEKVQANSIYFSFSDEDSVVRMEGVENFDFLIPIEPFKSLVKEGFEQEDINRVRAELGLGGRKMIVVGSPKDSELQTILSAYQQLYAAVPVQERPLLVVGTVVPYDESQLERKFELNKEEFFIRDNIDAPFPEMNNQSVLFLQTEGELAKMYHVAEGRGIAIVGEDRNLAEAGVYLPVLTFPGAWTNNFAMRETMEDSIRDFNDAQQMAELLSNDELRASLAALSGERVRAYREQFRKNPELWAVERDFTLDVIEGDMASRGDRKEREYSAPESAHQRYVLEQIYFDVVKDDTVRRQAQEIFDFYYDLADAGGFSNQELKLGLMRDLGTLGKVDVTTIAAFKPFLPETASDRALLSNPSEKEAPGGIDLDPDNLSLRINSQGQGFNLPIDHRNFTSIQVDGLIPVILNVVPTTNLPQLLGMTDVSF